MDPPDLTTRFRTLSIIWLSLMMGVVLFSIVVWVIVSGVIPDSNWAPHPSFDEALLQKVVFGPAIMLLAGLVIRRGEVGRPGMDVTERFSAYQIRVLMAGAVQEMGGLIMGALALLSGEGEWALGFGALTVFALLLARPRTDDLRTLNR